MSNSLVVDMASGRVKQSLTALKAGQESLGKFVTDLFAEFDVLRQQVAQAEAKLQHEQELFAQQRKEFAEQLDQRSAEPSEADGTLQARLVEMDQNRKALEEELIELREKTAGMAETIAGHKQEMADEHAEWSAELRQLRRILDKQATWIELKAEPPPSVPSEPAKLTKSHPTTAAAQSPAGHSTRLGSTRSRIIPANAAGGAEST